MLVALHSFKHEVSLLKLVILVVLIGHMYGTLVEMLLFNLCIYAKLFQ